MRLATLLALPLLGGLIGVPTRAPAQVNVTIGAKLGPEIGVFAYTPERLGDWRGNYQKWTPVTLYDINGHYYRTQASGARPVWLYRYGDQYFLPPRDQGWRGFDKRFEHEQKYNGNGQQKGKWKGKGKGKP